MVSAPPGHTVTAWGDERKHRSQGAGHARVRRVLNAVLTRILLDVQDRLKFISDRPSATQLRCETVTGPTLAINYTDQKRNEQWDTSCR